MTEAEKAAEAAKAEETRKAAAAEAAKKLAEEDDEEDDGSEEVTPEAFKKMKEQLSKVKGEAKERRLENKKLKDDADKRAQEALDVLTGKRKGGEDDPLAKVKKDADEKMSRTLLRAEFMALAKDAHDPSMTFKAFASEMTDVEVDLENESVDVDALKGKLDEFRKRSPFLFQSQSDLQDETKPIKRNPDGSGRASGGGSEYKQWQALQQSGNRREAQEFYNKNRVKILTQLPAAK